MYTKSLRRNTIIFCALIASFSIGGLSWTWNNSKSFQRLISSVNQKNSNNPQVLGYQYQPNRYLYISGEKGGLSGGVIALASTDEPNIQISGYNISGSANVELYRGSIDTVLQYLTHNSNYNQTQKISTDGLPLVLQTTYDVLNNGEPRLLPLPLEKDGVYVVKLRLNGVEEVGLIVRSSIGGVLKNAESDLLVWTRSFETKQSITQGQVRIYNLENSPRELSVAPIGNDGIAHCAILSEADIAIIESGEYRALLPINLKHINDPSAKYKQYAARKQQERYFTFTDRPIYQPGDTVSYKSIIRDDNDNIFTLPSGNAEVLVSQGYGDSEQKICQATIPISDQGSIDGECVLPKTMSPGYYSVKVSYKNRDQYYLSGQSAYFQVEHYRKPEYSIEVDSDKSTYISGDQMKFTVKGSYFYGQPLANMSIDYVLTRSNYWTYDYYAEFENRPDDESSFSWYGSYGSEVTKGQVTLDKDGQATITLPATGTDDGKNQIISLEATAVDETQNPAFSRKSVLVYAGEFGIFKKDYQSSFKTGESATIPFMVKTWQGKMVENQSIQVQLTRIWYTETQNPDSKYSTYTKQTETLPEMTITSDKNGQAVLNFTPTIGGSYTINLKGKDNRQNSIQSEFSIYVYQPNSNINTSQTDSEYRLSLNQTKYLPNDIAKLSITHDGGDQDVLLTLQRNYVHRYQVVHLSGDQTVVDIPLENNDTPNIYASISGFNQKYFQSNDVSIAIPPRHKQLVVSIKPDRQTYGPGDTASVAIKTTSLAGKPQKAEVALWAIDKSLFELAASDTGDIMNTFWSERYNGTNTSHSLEGVSAEMAEGGGGCFSGDTPILLADGTTRPIKDIKVGDRIKTRVSETDNSFVDTNVLGTHVVKVPGIMIINGAVSVTPEHKVFLNNKWQPIGNAQVGDRLVDSHNDSVVVASIEWRLQPTDVYNLETAKYHTFFAGNIWVHNQKGGARTVLKDTAYWNPTIKTNDQGEAVVQIKVPDNLTTWSLAAIGSTTDTMVGQSTGEILVSKNIIVRPVLPNIIRMGDEIQLSGYVHNYSDAKHAFSVSMQVDDATVEPATQIVNVKSQENVLVTWKVKPTKVNQAAKVTLKAVANDVASLNDAVVVPLPIYSYGFFTDRAENIFGSGEKTIQYSNDIDIANSSTSISLAPSLMANVLEALESLVGYPYGCSEQTATKLMTAVIAHETGVLEKALKNEDYKLDDITTEAYTHLAELQLNDGTWGWWKNSNPQLYVTAYIAEALGKSQQAHLEVNATPRIRLKAYYRDQSPPRDHKELVLKTYAQTFLEPEIKGEQLVYEQGDTDDIVALAAIANFKNGHGTELMDVLASKAQKQGDSVFWTSGPSEYFGSEITSTGLALQALSLAGSTYKQEVNGAVWYLLQSRKQSYWSSTFASVQAIKGLLAYAKSNQELTPNFSYSVLLDGNTVKEGKITSSNQLIRKIIVDSSKIKKEGSKVSVQMNGDGQLYSTVSIHELHHQPRSAAESHGFTLSRRYVNQKGQINQFAVGDLVTVELTVADFQGPLSYLAVEDQLPAGMIPVNTNLNNEQENQPAATAVFSEADATPYGMILAAPMIDKPTTFTYKARVVSQGTFNTPPATAHLMYAQENYARTDGLTVTINKNSSKIMGSNGLYISTALPINYNLIMYIACPLIFLIGGILFFFLRRQKLKQRNQIIHEQNYPPSTL